MAVQTGKRSCQPGAGPANPPPVEQTKRQFTRRSIGFCRFIVRSKYDNSLKNIRVESIYHENTGVNFVWRVHPQFLQGAEGLGYTTRGDPLRRDTVPLRKGPVNKAPQLDHGRVVFVCKTGKAVGSSNSSPGRAHQPL